MVCSALELRRLPRRRADRGGELADAALDMADGALADRAALGRDDRLVGEPSAKAVDPAFGDRRDRHGHVGGGDIFDHQRQTAARRPVALLVLAEQQVIGNGARQQRHGMAVERPAAPLADRHAGGGEIAAIDL